MITATGTGDRFTTWDAAYVLHALSPGERREFRNHMSQCLRCAAAVAELIGLPGLLDRAARDPGEF